MLVACYTDGKSAFLCRQALARPVRLVDTRLLPVQVPAQTARWEHFRRGSCRTGALRVARAGIQRVRRLFSVFHANRASTRRWTLPARAWIARQARLRANPTHRRARPVHGTVTPRRREQARACHARQGGSPGQTRPRRRASSAVSALSSKPACGLAGFVLRGLSLARRAPCRVYRAPLAPSRRTLGLQRVLHVRRAP